MFRFLEHKTYVGSCYKLFSNKMSEIINVREHTRKLKRGRLPAVISKAIRMNMQKTGDLHTYIREK